ncbi:MAG: TRAP transporter large permease subunit, partial [Dehalococcoidales bacterium]|nr:TRAP transporter large permease subunit [Dehalococcoidales bacterium]
MISILIILLALLFGGFWVAFSLTGAGVYGLFVSMGSSKALNLASVLTWNYANSVILTAIPLFIFMGEIILRTGMGNRLYNGVSPWLRSAPGGLLHTNIAACALFSAITGSSVACAATIGSVAYPELEKRGYDKKLVTGSLAAGGTLGILIPPSLAFIIYGAMIEESIGQLFMAGLIPGIILALLFSATIVVLALMNPTAVPKEHGATWKERLLSIKDVWQVLFIMVAVLGGIYMGVMTPTEAAAIGAILALLMAAVSRTLTWKALKDSLMSTVHTTS